MVTREVFAEALRKRGHTLSTLARKLELTVPSVWAWANERSRPDPFHRQMLAKELGLDESLWLTEREARVALATDESGPLPEAAAVDSTGTDS